MTAGDFLKFAAALPLITICMVHPAQAQPDGMAPDSVRRIETVVVTGQFSPRSVRSSVYRVRVIGREQIARKAAPSVVSLLDAEIGVRLSNDMELGETDLELMGMGGANVKVMVDGVPVIDRGANRQSIGQIDINSVDRVEIVEGPMSVVYGTDALAGVVNVITKRVTVPVAKNVWSIGANVREESIGREYSPLDGRGLHSENVSVGWAGRSGFHAGGGLTRNASGGWRGDRTGRERMWQPRTQYMYNAAGGYSGSGFGLRGRLDYLDEKIQTPLNGIAPDIVDRDYLTKRYNAQLHVDWRASGRVSVNLVSSWQDYERRTRTVVTDTGTGERWLSMEESAQDVSAMRSAFVRATALWRPAGGLTLQPGVEYRRDEGSGERIAGSHSLTDMAAFLSAEWTVTEKLSLRPGARAFIVSDYDAPAVVPAVMAKYVPGGDVDLRVSYARGFRAPALRELYFSFHNANHNIDGNPDLGAESSDNFSASLAWEAVHTGGFALTSTLSGFYNDFRDRIALAVDAADAAHMTYYNVDRYRTLGATLENSFAWREVRASLGVSLVGRSSSLPGGYGDLARFRYSPEVSASVAWSLPRTGTGVALFCKFTGRRYEYTFALGDLAPAERGMDAYTWADVTVTQRVGRMVSVQGGVRNLLDVTTVANSAAGPMSSASGSSLVGCGRSWFVGLAFNFSTLKN